MPHLPALTDELFDPATGGEFDFFQAVLVLEAVLAADLPPALDPVDRLADAVRVRAYQSLTFPTSSVARVGRPGVWDGEPEARRPVANLAVTFFGLTGPTGTLPVGYTEMVCRLRNFGDPLSGERTALRDWLDLFNHRLGVLLYAGW
jgi:type VI secretion system protein ImpH